MLTYKLYITATLEGVSIATKNIDLSCGFLTHSYSYFAITRFVLFSNPAFPVHFSFGIFQGSSDFSSAF